MKTQKPAAYTLVELLIGIVVLVIVLTIGIPSYIAFSRNNAIASIAYTFQTSLKFARNAAIQRGTSISICAANQNFSQCTGTSQWTNGWLIFIDPNQIGTVTNRQNILRTETTSSDQVHIESTSGATVTFEATGFPTNNTTTLQFTIKPDGCSLNHARRITLENTGLARVEAIACD